MNKLNGLIPYNFKKFKKENLTGLCFYRYFPNIERLTSFLIDGVFMCRADKFSDNLECIKKDIIDELNSNSYIIEDLAQKVITEQKKYYISCWYFPDSNNENELMWKSYGNTKDNEIGFLVKINSLEFINSLEDIYNLNRNSIVNLLYGTVRYFDFNDSKSIRKIRFTSFRKHICFKDEREFRLVFKDEGSIIKDKLFLKLPKKLMNEFEIFAQPSCSKIDFDKYSNELKAKFQINLKKSELDIWYNLRENIRKIDG